MIWAMSEVVKIYSHIGLNSDLIYVPTCKRFRCLVSAQPLAALAAGGRAEQRTAEPQNIE